MGAGCGAAYVLDVRPLRARPRAANRLATPFIAGLDVATVVVLVAADLAVAVALALLAIACSVLNIGWLRRNSRADNFDPPTF